MAIEVITPQWPAPVNVGAAITLCSGGCSRAPFGESNLALHVQDDPRDVVANRQSLKQSLKLPAQPLWLDQVHGTEIVSASKVCESESSGTPKADGSYSDEAGAVCAVLTADCLPVLLCDSIGSQVAAAHAGWRGLCGGILRKTVATFKQPPDQMLAYLGPAIGPQVFEVGGEVLQAFLDHAQNPQQQKAIVAAFTLRESAGDKYLADLYALARAELQASGVTQIYGGDYCSYSDSERFYSYRREPKTGRNGSLIWLRG
jgi:YfiH family protein